MPVLPCALLSVVIVPKALLMPAKVPEIEPLLVNVVIVPKEFSMPVDPAEIVPLLVNVVIFRKTLKMPIPPPLVEIEPVLLMVKLHRSGLLLFCVVVTAVLITVSPLQAAQELLFVKKKPTPSATTDTNTLNLDRCIWTTLLSKKFCCREGTVKTRCVRGNG